MLHFYADQVPAYGKVKVNFTLEQWGTYMLQVVLSQLTLAPESDSYLRDEEGSGSGHPPVTQWYDDGEAEDPNWPDEGSASGDNPLPPGNM
jgi:hypothetical protein